ncbi:MAG: endolytic transglycosylase MltG, partial [Microbacteriaceae bacterium]|nr:endolytic transglycosylase MltG [Microbacteriaceae bacterium]
AAARKKNRRKKSKKGLIVLLVMLLLIGAGGAFVVANYGEKIFGSSSGDSVDYDGEGSGEAKITINPGDGGEAIAMSLEKAGVIKKAKTFVTYLTKEQPKAIFHPGTYKLRQKMSSAAAFKLLQDPASKAQNKVTIPEGTIAANIFKALAKETKIPEQEFVAAAKDYKALGVPAKFPSIEGFLFPATYEFEPEDTAKTILQKMVDRTKKALKQHNVPEDKTFEILTMAALVQREAGSIKSDFPKIARVFYNRLERGIKLESDATVAYGTGRYESVWTKPEERADKSNKYNTYANPGLPAGPIGAPGDLALEAAMKPTPGSWLFFMAINLETGETGFANTAAEHDKNVEKLAAWCTAHRANGGKRCD